MKIEITTKQQLQEFVAKVKSPTEMAKLLSKLPDQKEVELKKSIQDWAKTEKNNDPQKK